MHSDDATTETQRNPATAPLQRGHLSRAARESQRKDQFIATVAHELRNMMAPLDSALELLEQGHRDPELVGRALPVARRQVRHLCHLVDDLLDIGRIVNDQLVLERTVLVLQQMVEETAAACGPMFQARHQQLTLRLDPTPAQVRGDAVRWAQIVTNLLHNASKFTPPGGFVEIVLKVDPDGRTAELRVADNGCGIAPSELENIFGIFRRTRTRPGLGIGLAVVRRLVELHGGTIHAESAGPNLGAAFVVRVPLLPEAPPVCPAAIQFTRP
jgi:signal transduction histidine kinase